MSHFFGRKSQDHGNFKAGKYLQGCQVQPLSQHCSQVPQPHTFLSTSRNGGLFQCLTILFIKKYSWICIIWCVSILCISSEAPLTFAGLLAALRSLLEKSQEMAQRNQMLQVQNYLCT